MNNAHDCVESGLAQHALDFCPIYALCLQSSVTVPIWHYTFPLRLELSCVWSRTLGCVEVGFSILVRKYRRHTSHPIIIPFFFFFSLYNSAKNIENEPLYWSSYRKKRKRDIHAQRLDAHLVCRTKVQYVLPLSLSLRKYGEYPALGKDVSLTIADMKLPR